MKNRSQPQSAGAGIMRLMAMMFSMLSATMTQTKALNVTRISLFGWLPSAIVARYIAANASNMIDATTRWTAIHMNDYI
jgi:hypothetical protein